jgi:cobaltochelatase CobS
MSKGRIIKPRNPNFPNNPLEKNVYDIIYTVVPTLEIEVENKEWETADKELREIVTKTNNQLQETLTKIDNQLKEDVKLIEKKVSSISNQLGSNEGNLTDELNKIKQEIENIKRRKPIEVIVKVDNTEANDLGTQHFQFPTLLQILSTKLNIYLVGPAGSGKTTAAINCAKALEIPFHFTGAIASEFKLTGFINAQGQIVSTEFRKAYENGGLFLFDEIDASYPQAILAFNAALANDYMDFPDKCVPRHKDFYCIAAANTFGQGADRQYIGRNQLDAASLDRFVFIDWKFDENLERELAGNDKWVDFVQEVRKIIVDLKIRHVVSPRASIFGAKLLAKGIERKAVENSVIWKGLDTSTISTILKNLKNH